MATTAAKLGVLMLLLASANVAVSDECRPEAQSPTESAWVKGDRHNFDDADAGFSVGFRSPHGMGTIFVYDAGISDWAAGITDPRLTGQIDEIKAGLQEMVRRGRYSDLNVAEAVVRQLFCREFLLLTLTAKQDGRPVQGTAAVAVMEGKVVKLRTSFYSDPPAGIEAETAALLREALTSGALE